MRANRLEAAAGLRWIAEAFLIFRAAPMRQLFGGLAFLFALTVAMSIPLVGFGLVWLLVPALVVGPHEIARLLAVLPAVGQQVHELVGERERQITGAVGDPDGIGELGTGCGIREADRFRIECRPVARVVHEEYRRLRNP